MDQTKKSHLAYTIPLMILSVQLLHGIFNYFCGEFHSKSLCINTTYCASHLYLLLTIAAF